MIFQGIKVSPSRDFFIELYKKQEGNYTFCVKNKYDRTIYNPLETDGLIYDDDMLDWSKHCDVLFFSTNHLNCVFLFDLRHHQFYSQKLTNKQIALWDDEGSRWLLRERAYSIGEKDYYIPIGELKSIDYMSNAPEQKIIDVPESDYCLWLTKYTIKTYDRNVWKIAIFSKGSYKLLVEDLGYFAAEDSVRITGNNYINFYGYTADSNALYIVNFQPKEKINLFIWECPPIAPMRIEWFPDENFWRTEINNTIIRPRPFYFDTHDTIPVNIENKSIPLKLMNLIVTEKPEFQELYDKYLKKKREAQISEYEHQNTPVEELVRRANSGTQFFQRRKARIFMSHKENPRKEALYYFLIATVLLFAFPTIIAIAAYHKWQMNGVTMKNIATSMVLLGSLWLTTLSYLLSFRKKVHNSIRRTLIIVIIIVCSIVLLIIGITKANAQNKNFENYFEKSVQLSETSTKEEDLQLALIYANKAAENGVNGVLFLLDEMYSGNTAPNILDERNTHRYYSLQSITPQNDSIAFEYYKRYTDLTEDSDCVL